jgi:dTDP-4-amino-4,6-dideoxygalactose transaminase
MNVPFLDLNRQTAMIRDELDKAVSNVLDDGHFVLGPRLAEFESRFAEYCDTTHVIGVASGTDAITIALQAVGVAPGDEVITAANTCVPTVAAIEAAGAIPVLVDIDPTTYTLDPAAADAAVTERTRAIVPVHLYGQCADMNGVLELASRHGLKVVEDAAQAHGAMYQGRSAGTLGDASAFSFYPTKNLGALGDGGAVVTGDEAVAEQARLLRSYGERERYDSVRRGWNSRLDPLHASVLTTKLRHLDAWNDRRREIAGVYRELLSDAEVRLPTEADGRHHVYHLFVVRVADRDAFRSRLAAEGVATLVHYPRPVHMHPAYKWLASSGQALDESERASAEIVSLPLFPELEDGEIHAVAQAVVKAARSSSASTTGAIRRGNVTRATRRSAHDR